MRTNFIGIDSIRCICSTKALYKFIEKQGLRVFTNLCNQKVVYYNKELVFIFKSSNYELDLLCKKRHKRYGYYSLVEFLGLNQPQRKNNNLIAKHKITAFFIRKYCIYNIDLSVDFLKDNNSLNSIFINSTISYKARNYQVYKNTIYANIHNKKVDKIKLYDKFKKETIKFNKFLPKSLEKWKRLEFTFNIKAKFKQFIGSKKIFNYIFLMLKSYRQILGDICKFGFNQMFLKRQLSFLKDVRKTLLLKGIL